MALLIMAGGILGLSALLSSSLRVSQGAGLRTQAALLAQDIAERMRANRAGVAGGFYDGTAPAPAPACAEAAGCTAAQRAAEDLATWAAAVAALLPAGAQAICRDASPEDGSPDAPACDGGGELQVLKLWWDDDRDGRAEQRYVISFRP